MLQTLLLILRQKRIRCASVCIVPTVVVIRPIPFKIIHTNTHPATLPQTRFLSQIALK